MPYFVRIFRAGFSTRRRTDLLPIYPPNVSRFSTALSVARLFVTSSARARRALVARKILTSLLSPYHFPYHFFGLLVRNNALFQKLISAFLTTLTTFSTTHRQVALGARIKRARPHHARSVYVKKW